jgi:mannose-6-phosphate isomerase-like protein (cupin superfamily)
VTAIDAHCPDRDVVPAALRGGGIEPQLAALREIQRNHPFWNCRLLAGFAQGAFSRDDLRYIFSQYHLYTSSFTRFLAAVMVNCESQLFRNFLHRSLGIADVAGIAYEPFTRQFVGDYLDQALRYEPMAATAFLAIGTEGIVPRVYEIMRRGLRQAGIPDNELEFFDIHIACDDAHAVTLEHMMVSYADRPGWFEACAGALNRALDLRTALFDHLFDALHKARLDPMLARMHARRSLATGLDDAALYHRPGGDTVAMYANEVEKLNIQFTVERLPVAAEVLDPRMVRIPAGKFNENHRHAHETLIHILDGSGQVVIDDRVLPVRAGDTVLVPRWAMHQTQNLGSSELRFLAVTDFNLSRRAFLGDPTDYRMHADVDGRRRRTPA